MSERRRPGSVVRALVSVMLLVGLALLLDPAAVADRLGSLRLSWVGAGLALGVVQIAASAWRWRYTAGQLGLRLPFRTALREYYLASFLNQVLPGGVLGDVSRAWRHARVERRGPVGSARSFHAVVIERLSGQVVMTGVAIVSVAFLLASGRIGTGGVGTGGVGLGAFGRGGAALALVLGTGVVAGLVAARARARLRGGWAATFVADVRRALLCRAALPTQLATSLVVVASYLAVFLMAARAVGLDTPTTLLLPMLAPVLVTMLIPVTFAGWGLRESTAAALWALAGLTPADGVAVSVAYGVIVLVTTLPGALVLTGTRADEPQADPLRSRSNRTSSPSR